MKYITIILKKDSKPQETENLGYEHFQFHNSC